MQDTVGLEILQMPSCLVSTDLGAERRVADEVGKMISVDGME
jgi:hypothetical protein